MYYKLVTIKSDKIINRRTDKTVMGSKEWRTRSYLRKIAGWVCKMYGELREN